MRDDSGINFKRTFGSFVGMTEEVSSLFFFFTRLVITTTQQQEVERGSAFTMSHVPVAIWLSLLFILERIFFYWLPWPARSKTKRSCSVGTKTEPETAPTSSPTRQRTSHTVMITENGVQSTMIHRSSPVCSNLIHSMKSQCPSPSAGVFAAWAAFAVEDVKGYALLDTGASRSVGGYNGAVCDRLSLPERGTTLVGISRSCSKLHFCRRRKAHSETLIWLPLPVTRKELFAVHVVPSEVTPILLGLDMLREFVLVINVDLGFCFCNKLRCRIPVTVLP